MFGGGLGGWMVAFGWFGRVDDCFWGLQSAGVVGWVFVCLGLVYGYGCGFGDLWVWGFRVVRGCCLIALRCCLVLSILGISWLAAFCVGG